MQQKIPQANGLRLVRGARRMIVTTIMNGESNHIRNAVGSRGMPGPIDERAGSVVTIKQAAAVTARDGIFNWA